MTVHRFYYPGQLEVQDFVTLSSTESAHALKVLRLRPDDEMILLNGKGTEAIARLEGAPDKRRMHEAICHIDMVKHHEKSQRPVHLYVAPPKTKCMDIVLKSATELGVSLITPIICRYGVSKIEGEFKESWRNQLVIAIKQSGNPWLPELQPPTSVEDALKSFCGSGYFGSVCKSEKSILPPWDRPVGETSLWIGPEGGFAPEEESMMLEHGLYPLTVGNWILRVETAVSALLACMNVRIE